MPPKTINRAYFSQTDINRFRELSFDSNPLHINPSYARKTNFGEPVVYGVCSVLFALGKWSEGRTFAITKLKADFRKPLFIDQEFSFSIQETGNRVQVTFSRQNTLLCKVSFSWVVFHPPQTELHSPQRAFQPRLNPRKEELKEYYSEDVSYCINLNKKTILDLNDSLHLSSNQLPKGQLSALVWSSYFVGMEYPGEQALFSSLSIDFSLEPCNKPEILFSRLQGSYDDRFNQIEITGVGTGIESLTISAFCRPKPLMYPLSEFMPASADLCNLANKMVFITGASRGFEAALTKAAAIAKSRLVLNFMHCDDEIQNIINEIVSVTSAPMLIKGDAGSPETYSFFQEFLEQEKASPDFLILNASPPIPSRLFKEQNTKDLLQFVERSLRLVIEPCLQIIPKMKSGNTVLLISTSYVTCPIPMFSQYVAAKSAAEGFLRALSVEYPDKNFIIARPPKMLTDQTNVAIPTLDTHSPIAIAELLLKKLLTFDRLGSKLNNFFEIDLNTL